MLKNLNLRQLICLGLIFAFLVNTLGPIPTANAGPIYSVEGELHLPAPGTLVSLSPDFTPAVLKGITIHPENPLMFDFIIYRGDKILSNDQKQVEYKKLVKYFLASLAIPDEDQWVNLSPYEKDRIIKDDFGKTLMGRDLLSQDYILKQITASLIYPEKELGKKFWANVYAKAQAQYGTTNIPVNTFNKVWILPDQALVYEKGNTAYVLKSHLKVMLEEDYLALSRHVIPANAGIQKMGTVPISSFNKGLSPFSRPSLSSHALASQIIRQIILPALQKEINEGQNFAMLRQVYSGMILSAWFKRTLRKSILGQIYADKSKIAGIAIPNSSTVIPANGRINRHSQLLAGIQNMDINGIYERYLQAYKKGVFNYIKEDADNYTNETVPRKYFSGGFADNAQSILEVTDNAMLGNKIIGTEVSKDDSAQVIMGISKDAAMLSDKQNKIVELMLNEIIADLPALMDKKHDILIVAPERVDQRQVAMIRDVINVINMDLYREFQFRLKLVERGKRWGVIVENRSIEALYIAAGYLLQWLTSYRNKADESPVLRQLQKTIAGWDYKRLSPDYMVEQLNKIFNGQGLEDFERTTVRGLSPNAEVLTSDGFISDIRAEEEMESGHLLFKAFMAGEEIFFMVKTANAAMTAEEKAELLNKFSHLGNELDVMQKTGRIGRLGYKLAAFEDLQISLNTYGKRVENPVVGQLNFLFAEVGIYYSFSLEGFLRFFDEISRKNIEMTKNIYKTLLSQKSRNFRDSEVLLYGEKKSTQIRELKVLHDLDHEYFYRIEEMVSIMRVSNKIYAIAPQENIKKTFGFTFFDHGAVSGKIDHFVVLSSSPNEILSLSSTKFFEFFEAAAVENMEATKIIYSNLEKQVFSDKGTDAQTLKGNKAMMSQEHVQRILPLTDLKNFDPNHFVLAVKVSGLRRLLKPKYRDPLKDPFFSLSVINQDHLSTYFDIPWGIVAEFLDEDLRVVLRQMNMRMRAELNKSPASVYGFIWNHHIVDESNVIYDSVTQRKKLNPLTEDEIFSPPARSHGANNNEIIVNVERRPIQTPAIELTVSEEYSMPKIVHMLRSSFLHYDPNDPEHAYEDGHDLYEAIMEGKPVLILGQKGVDLEKAQQEFREAFPNAEKIGTNQFQIKQGQSLAMTAGIIPIVNLIGRQEDIIDMREDDFEGNSLKDIFYYLDKDFPMKVSAMPNNAHILVIGGTVSEIKLLFARYPQSSISVINYGKMNLLALQNYYKTIPEMNQKLHLFQGDARYLSDYHDPDGAEYFPEASFNLVIANGVDFSAFTDLPLWEGKKILIKIARQEASVVARGGIIAHRYEYENSVQYQTQAINDGVLEVLGVPKKGLFVRIDKSQSSKNGGIDFNSSNLSMMIKRDGKGVVLPLAQQDLAELSNIKGLDPSILSIKPASQTPLFSQLQSSI